MDFDNEENIDYELNKIAANIIKEKRLNKKYSLDDVVNRMDNIITKQSLYRYESNEARMKNGIFKKICLALGEDPSNVWNDINNRFIHRLQFDNAELVKYDPNDDNIAYIPILGTIKAGIPIEAQQNILEYVDIPKKWLDSGKTFYGLKISGDSMYPKYQPNDIVIFEKIDDMYLADNKDCAIYVNGFDATFKKVKLNQNGITLIPYNQDNTDGFETTYYDEEQITNLPIKIIGIAREKRTRL